MTLFTLRTPFAFQNFASLGSPVLRRPLSFEALGNPNMLQLDLASARADVLFVLLLLFLQVRRAKILTNSSRVLTVVDQRTFTLLHSLLITVETTFQVRIIARAMVAARIPYRPPRLMLDLVRHQQNTAPVKTPVPLLSL